MSGEADFKGKITVASRIVDALSSGLYESPAACLKELVNNSYDADAENVFVFVKPDADQIIIEDDGIGMNQEEFERHFERISESHKRDEGDVTEKYRRPMVGKIGIGFIAANELCDLMEIESTKAGSPALMRVEIDFKEMRLDPEERRVDKGTEFRKGDYEGWIEEADPDSHFTRVYLRGVRGTARDILAGAHRQASTTQAPSLYGLKPSSIVRRLRAPKLESWTDLDQYSQTFLGVALNVPVRYPDHWVPENLQPKVADLVKELEQLHFVVMYDGSEMRKPVVLGEDGKPWLFRRFAHHGEHVAADGYFFAQHGTLRPKELNGVLIRIRHAAVGAYDRSFMGYPTKESQLFKNWITSELWVDDRLESAMNIDRKTLRVTHPAYVELQSAFHTFFKTFLADVRRELYSTPSQVRKTEKASTESRRISEAVKSRDLTISAPVAKRVEQAWAPPDDSRRGTRELLRTYSVAEFYELVLDVAARHLEGDALDAFVDDLTERLRRRGPR